MTNSLVKIGNAEIPIKEYNGQRVVTFKDIDNAHKRPEGTARKHFNNNKKRFIEGEDYYKMITSEFRKQFESANNAENNNTAKRGNPNIEIVLMTENGYCILARSFKDDLAWDVQRKLVKNYFKTDTPKLNTPLENHIETIKTLNIKMKMHDGIPKVSSREVAKKTKRGHSSVMRSIRSLIAKKPKLPKTSFTLNHHKDTRGQTHREYLINKDGLMFLILGLTGKEVIDFKSDYYMTTNYIQEQQANLGIQNQQTPLQLLNLNANS